MIPFKEMKDEEWIEIDDIQRRWLFGLIDGNNYWNFDDKTRIVVDCHVIDVYQDRVVKVCHAN